MVVSESDAGYKCTCLSRKFPCKHAIALMWIRADNIAPFSAGSPPQWVSDWLSRRRDLAKAPVGKPGANARSGPRPLITATQLESEPDESRPKALAKTEAAKARKVLSAAPENLRLAVGIWRHIGPETDGE